MRDTPFHPQKRTLVEHVSDDIRSLKKADIEQQKTLLTGRALNDLLKGDRFDHTNEFDQKYFSRVTAPSGVNPNYIESRLDLEHWPIANTHKVDFNFVVDASIRYLDPNTYVHGPSGIVFGGFLHTASVLGSDTMSYDDFGGMTHGPEEGHSIRQIFYPDDLRDFEAYTRVGRYVQVSGTRYHTIEWSNWFQLSGRMLRVLITNNSDSALQTSNLRLNTIYELHCGGTEITLPNADNCPTGMSIIFEQYHNGDVTYVSVNKASTPTPSPNVRYFVLDGGRYIPAGTNSNGYIASFDSSKTYYTQSVDPSSWINTIKYSEKVLNASSTTPETRTYSLQTIADLSVLKVAASETQVADWYRGNSTAIQYRFEVVDRPSAVEGSYHTWMTDSDADAVQQFSDFAELLDAHTDPMMKDIVMYSERQFRNSTSTSNDGNVTDPDSQYAQYVPKANEPLIISRPASMNGYIKFSIGKTGDGTVANNFRMRIFVFNENSSEFSPSRVYSYSQKPSTETTPNIYKKYYVYNELNNLVLADGTGHPTAFESGKNYYVRSVTNSIDINPAKYRKFPFENPSADWLDADFSAAKVNSGATTGFITVARNDTVMVVINSDCHTETLRQVSISVEVYPDPHDSYVMKPNVSTGNVFTQARLDKMPKPGTNPEVLASSESLINAYKTLALALQKRGLLFGQRPAATSAGGSINFNQLTSPGLYTLNTTSNLVTNGPEDGSINQSGRTVNGELIVFTSTAYATDVILPKSESDSGASNKAATGTKTDRVTQLYIGNGGNLGGDTGYSTIWVRYGMGTVLPSDEMTINTSSEISWGFWVPMQPASITFTESNTAATSIAANAIRDYLRRGSPHIVIDRSTVSPAPTVTINLPAPTDFKFTKFQIEAINCKVIIKFTMNSTTYQFNGESTISSPNRMLYPIESDGNLWYITTVS